MTTDPELPVRPDIDSGWTATVTSPTQKRVADEVQRIEEARDEWQREVERLREVILTHHHDDWCPTRSHDDCCGKTSPWDCDCSKQTLVRRAGLEDEWLAGDTP